MTTQPHEPTREFTQYLEWQIATTVRRHDRFAEPVRTTSVYAKYLAAAAAIVVAMMIGAGGVAAAGRIQDNQQKQVLVQEQDSLRQLASMQLTLAEKGLDDAKRRVSVGAAPQSIVESAERDVRVAQIRLDRSSLDAAEVELSIRPVRNEISSPLVKGRDFVTVRLQLDLKAAGLALTSAELVKKQTQTRFEVGLVADVELTEADVALLRAQAAVQSVQDQLALRSRFVAGGLTAPQAVQQKALLAARSELKLAESALVLAEKRAELIKKRVAVGTTDEQDALAAQLDVLSKRADIESLQARIRQLERGGSDEPADVKR
jgi:hypothetical protein